MPTKISEAFGIDKAALNAEGAFDGFLDIDARLYVDPHLLSAVTTPELRDAHASFLNHFAGIISLMDASSRPGDRFFRQAVKQLTFPELNAIGLGYSLVGNPGSGIGPGLARKLGETAFEIVKAGVRDPLIFQLVGLFEEGIGADRVSDMTVSVILPYLAQYSQRVAANLGLPTTRHNLRAEVYALPSIRRRPIILVPLEILRDLPIAYEWSDIDYVCAQNEELRTRVNALIGASWKDATKRISKSQLRDALLRNPEAFLDLIAQYRQKPVSRYDFARDPAGEVIWYDIARQAAAKWPLDIDVSRPLTGDDILPIVRQICNKFRELVEANGLSELLYSDRGKLRHERFAQKLFYGIADSYCEHNDLDLSREPNGGRGPVDFKVSRGARAKVSVEIKYSSNKALIKGYTKQLPIYNRAERANGSVYLIIRTTESTAAIDEVIELERQAMARGERAPEVIVIDGRIQPSASRA